MSTSATIMQFPTPQTPTAVLKPTIPERFGVLLDMVEAAVTSDAPHGCDPADGAVSRWATAYDALCDFINEPAVIGQMFVCEFAMALERVMSADPATRSEMIGSAHAINMLSMKWDFVSSVDWDARPQQARQTASLMFAMMDPREQSNSSAQRDTGLAPIN